MSWLNYSNKYQAATDSGLDVKEKRAERKYSGRDKRSPRTAMSYACKNGRHRDCTAMKCECSCGHDVG